MNSNEKILFLVNESNGPPKLLTSENVSFDIPAPDVGDTWDTKVILKSVPGKGYIGDAELFYTRIPLEDLGLPQTLRSVSGFTKETMLGMFNGKLGSFVGVDDLEPFEVPDIGIDETKTVTLVAKPTSLGWRGTAEITLSYGRTYLDAVVVNRLLPVRIHANAVNGYPTAQWLSDKIDFTSFRDALVPIFNIETQLHYLADPIAIQDVCKLLGFPDFEPGSVVHAFTADVADCNKSFDLVAIVSIVSDSMIGPLYLHYNSFDEA